MGVQSTSERFIGGKHPIRDNLLLYFDTGNINSYNNTGTTWYDLSGNTTNSTLENDGMIDTLDNKGPMFGFDGNNDFIDINQKILFASATSNISIEIWFRVGSIALSGLANQGAGQSSFGVELTQNGKVQMVARGGATAQATSTTTLVAGKYYHAVGTYATTPSTKIYLNGKFEAQSTTNPNITVASLVDTNFKIGHSDESSDSSKSSFFDGKVAILRFYEKTLSADEVAYNFNVDRGRFQI